MSAFFLVTYDRNHGDDYEALFKKIKECGTAWHGMQNTWFVESQLTAMQIANHCAPVLDSSDKLFVSQIGAAAWIGFAADGTQWLQAKIAA
jgi:hypothetical protein